MKFNIKDNIQIKKYKPTSPGMRGRILVLDKEIEKEPFSSIFLKKLSRKKFRNSKGNLVNYHRSFGHKKLYRIVDFKRTFLNFSAKVIRFEYDPNRNVSLALLLYENGTYSYILKNESLKIGDKVISSWNKPNILNIGDNFKLNHIPIGESICNISEGSLYSKSKYLRSSGMYGKIISKQKDKTLVTFSSGITKLFDSNSTATIGTISGSQKKLQKQGKAGANRWIGKRPHVRGVAMNPVDHPHGGNTAGGRPSVSRWGNLAKSVVKIKKVSIAKQVRQ